MPREMIRILVATLTGKYIKVDIAQDAIMKVCSCTLGCCTLASPGVILMQTAWQLLRM